MTSSVSRRDAVDDVVDADRLRDVMDEEDQPADAEQRQQHRAGTVSTGTNGTRQRPRRRQGGHAVGERAEEDAQRPLRDAIADEADEDARRELRRGERQRHQQDREDDRHDGHDRGGDAGQDGLRDLRIGVRGKQHLRHPGGQRGERLLELREQHPRAPSARAIANGRTRNPPRSA